MATKKSKARRDADDLCEAICACCASAEFIRKHGVTRVAWEKCNDPYWLGILCDELEVPWRYRMMAAALCVQAFRNNPLANALYADLVHVARGRAGVARLSNQYRYEGSLASDLWHMPGERRGVSLQNAACTCLWYSRRNEAVAMKDFADRIRAVIPWPMVKDCIRARLAMHRARNLATVNNYDHARPF